MILRYLNILLVFAASILMSTNVHSFETVLPVFNDSSPDFFGTKKSIIRQMSKGPDFFGHYTIVQSGCGTDCSIVTVGDNRTGELYRFPFGGEENMYLQLEYGINANTVYASYADNPFIKTTKGLQPTYGLGESPCRAKLLRFIDGKFKEEASRAAPRYNRYCPKASELFRLNENGLSDFEEACFSKYTRFNVCEHAKLVVKEGISSLPKNPDPYVTVLSFMSEGPKLITRIKWELSAKEIKHRLAVNNLNKSQLQEKMRKYTVNYVCAQKALSAFIRLGGTIYYQYLDQHYRSVADLYVSDCK